MISRKRRVSVIIISCVIIVSFVCVRSYNEKKYLSYSQEYTPGIGNIKGNVDVKAFTGLSSKFDIGANSYGYAVFKNPDAARNEMVSNYKDGLKLIQKEYKLKNISKTYYKPYETYGSQVSEGPDKAINEAYFISEFLDIYENSDVSR